jgi:uncharacterized protein YaeQ
MYNFEIELSDVDRGVYETLSLRAAQHPSESLDYLATRVLAYCFEFTEGLAVLPWPRGAGRAGPARPRPDRQRCGWIEIGLPEPARLHRASKASHLRVAVYAHRDPVAVAAAARGRQACTAQRRWR